MLDVFSMWTALPLVAVYCAFAGKHAYILDVSCCRRAHFVWFPSSPACLTLPRQVRFYISISIQMCVHVRQGGDKKAGFSSCKSCVFTQMLNMSNILYSGL